MNRIALILLLALPLTVVAQIYRTTDENGNIVYTDTPPASGTSTEKIKLNPTNTAPPPPDIYRPAPDDPEQPEQINYTADIVSPANETTIPMGPGNFSVTANVSPAPKAGESLRLYVDGTPWGEPQTAATWALSNVFRGAHDLTVSLLDSEGVPLITSDPIRVYVLRPSIHNRNRN